MLLEGVTYNINWTAFRRNSSIFLPCLNCAEVRAKVMKTMRRLKLSVETRITIEDGIRGLRVWRI